jgi:opacity protein-like surface antigen
MRARHWLAWSIAAVLSCTSVCLAQTSYTREIGPELGVDLLYQLSTDVGFNGGSRLDLQDDVGITLKFGYLFNPRFGLEGAVDWNNLDYDGVLQSAEVPGLATNISGEMETFTPRISALYYFLDGPLTPYVKGGIGWSFIDTNIPTGQVSIGCWWDPWWGRICTPYQPTKNVDGFAYQASVGMRWDFAPTWTTTLSYDKSWVDLDEASGTPDVDQFRAGIVYRY